MDMGNQLIIPEKPIEGIAEVVYPNTNQKGLFESTVEVVREKIDKFSHDWRLQLFD